jgi:acyl carrier protein
MNDDGTFSLIVDASHCLGLKESDRWKISDWLSEQGIGPYEEMNELFSKITIPLLAKELDITNPEITKMTFMSLYNLDKFRDFVFESTFLDRLEIEPERIEKIRNNDEDLLLLSFDWIEFGLFGKKVFGVKQKPSETTPSNI